MPEANRAATLSEYRKIKPADVNQALVALGFQIRKEKDKVWELTEGGREFGMALLATSKTNTWSGASVKWFKSIIPMLEKYFQSQSDSHQQIAESSNGKSNTDIKTSQQPPTTFSPTVTINEEPEQKVWFIEERIKHLGLKSSANQRVHLELYLAESYKERNGKPPGKQTYKNKSCTIVPASDVDLLDEAINKALKQNNTNLVSNSPTKT